MVCPSLARKWLGQWSTSKANGACEGTTIPCRWRTFGSYDCHVETGVHWDYHSGNRSHSRKPILRILSIMATASRSGVGAAHGRRRHRLSLGIHHEAFVLASAVRSQSGAFLGT